MKRKCGCIILCKSLKPGEKNQKSEKKQTEKHGKIKRFRTGVQARVWQTPRDKWP